MPTLQLIPGIELLQRIVDGKYPAPPIAALLNFTLTEVSEGRAVFHGMPSETISIRSAACMAAGRRRCSIRRSAAPCRRCLRKGEAYTTAEFKVNLTRPITPKTGEVVCEGRVVHKGRTLAVSEATLKDKNGKLLAFGTETCSIFPVANLAAR